MKAPRKSQATRDRKQQEAKRSAELAQIHTGIQNLAKLVLHFQTGKEQAETIRRQAEEFSANAAKSVQKLSELINSAKYELEYYKHLAIDSQQIRIEFLEHTLKTLREATK